MGGGGLGNGFRRCLHSARDGGETDSGRRRQGNNPEFVGSSRSCCMFAIRLCSHSFLTLLHCCHEKLFCLYLPKFEYVLFDIVVYRTINARVYG